MTIETHALYGAPPPDLATPPPGAVQLSPLSPGARSLEEIGDRSLASLLMLAPPGAIERRYALAHALRALAPGAPLTVLAPKDRGGSRLRKELEAFGCAVGEAARRHHRICHVEAPAEPAGLSAALAEGAPRLIPAIGLWSQPGVFSWDRVDPGSALLARMAPPLSGEGADLGCGVGYLARAVLESAAVKRLALIDNDRRAVEAARRNIADPRAEILWADARASGLEGLDFIITNPPFHDGGEEDRRLGQAFLLKAGQMLRRGGVLWAVANRHLPYEATLGGAFAKVEVRAEAGGYKVFEAKT